MLHLAVESAFDDLLAAWRAHSDRQRRGRVDVIELAASRERLDVARDRMHKLRRAIYPEHVEMESVLQTLWCGSLDAVVHLREVDRHLDRPGNLVCPCGELVAAF